MAADDAVPADEGRKSLPGRCDRRPTAAPATADAKDSANDRTTGRNGTARWSRGEQAEGMDRAE